MNRLKNLPAWPTVLVATVLMLLGCNDARPYFLTRNSAKHAIESQLGNSTDLYFTTGRQIVFGQDEATRYLETEFVPGLMSTFWSVTSLMTIAIVFLLIKTAKNIRLRPC